MYYTLNKSYPVKQWLCTLFFGPLLAALYKSLFYSYSSGFEYIDLFIILVVFGMGYSLPVLTIYYLCFFMLAGKIKNTTWLKVILNSIACTGVIVMYKLLGDVFFGELAIVYMILIICTSFLLKIRKVKKMNII